MGNPDCILVQGSSGLWPVAFRTQPLHREWTSESRAEAEMTEDCGASLSHGREAGAAEMWEMTMSSL